MLATQFESVGARAAFPCFDEPFYKAMFQYTLTVPDRGLTVLSNTPELGHRVQNGRLVVDFAKTKIRMSSYLVAFAVGKFDYVEQVDSDGIRFRVYTPPGASMYGQFALDLSVRVVKHFETQVTV